jgi:hypothetical protein
MEEKTEKIAGKGKSFKTAALENPRSATAADSPLG